MESEVHYKRVGIFLSIGVLLLIFIFVWLTKIFYANNQKQYLIYFEKQSLDGLQKDSVVTMKGIKIGTVQDYNISEENIQRVRVSVLIDADTPIKTDSRAVLKRNFLTGLAKIDILGGTQDSPSLTKADDDGIPIIKEELTQLDKLADTFPQLLSQTESTIQRINTLLSNENIEHFNNTMEAIGELATELKGIAPLVKDSAHSIKSLSERTDAFTQKYLSDNQNGFGVKVDKTLENIEALSQNLKMTSEHLEPLTRGTERSFFSIEESLRNISQDFKSLSETYSNPNLIIQKTQKNE